MDSILDRLRASYPNGIVLSGKARHVLDIIRILNTTKLDETLEFWTAYIDAVRN